jgi:Trk K+ transport system NAD-binding subunit
MKRPIVLCGLGRMGSRVLEVLQAAGLNVVVVDTACRPDDHRLRGARLVVGDCRRREVLEQAGVREAGGVLVLTGDDLLNVAAALAVRALNPDVRVVLRMFNQNLIGRLGQAVKNVYALSTSMLTAPILAMTALTGQALGAFRVEGDATDRRQIAEATVGAASEFRGRTIAAAAAARGLQVVAHLPGAGEPRYLHEVDLETRLSVGDRLVVSGETRAVSALLAGAGEADAPHLRWAGWLRRLARMVWRTFRQIDRPVLICTGLLVGVVLASTLLLHLAGGLTPANALLRTVGVMATVTGLQGAEAEPDWIKVYVSLLRIAGAALWAAFTAIVTNYLLRARLGGVLEVRRIPDGGHVVVCGLSPNGFRVVEELVHVGQKVVVIELAADNRFVATVRRLGAAVIIGDATVPEVLRQAHAGAARAVVAATNHDLVNLEVSLLVRELNPTQRVVLLLEDPNLAQMLREAANVRLAVSAPALAAPAFVAGLFGDRVQSVFLVRDRMFAVIDLVVQEQDSFLMGESVRAAAVDYRLLPVALRPSKGPAPAALLAARLAPGDRLVAIIALPDLENLLRRQTPPADCSVEVTGFPLPTRGWLAGLVRTVRGVPAEEAEAALDKLPLRLGNGLTRGRAEDLLAQLARERVPARLCRPDGV